MIQPQPPQQTDIPDLAPLLRLRELEDVLLGILAATFDSNRADMHEAEDGRDYSLVVDDTSGGIIKATLYRHDDPLAEAEVAQVRLDWAVTPTEGGAR